MIPGYMRSSISQIYCLPGMRDCDRISFAIKNFVDPSKVLATWANVATKGCVLRVEGKCLRPS